MSHMNFSSTHTSYNVFPRFTTDSPEPKSGDPGGKLSGDLVTFLAIADIHQIDLAWLDWDDALGALGTGGTSHILQSTLTGRASLAFKRYASSTSRTKADLSEEFKLAIAEVLVLSHHPTRYHPNLITLEGVSWDFSEETQQFLPVLLFERAPYGDLLSYLGSPSAEALNFPARLRLCQHIGTGLVAMHRFGIIHGDINPRNILIFDDNGKPLPKLSDFGYGALMAEGDAMRLATTWPWNAPEAEYTWSFTFALAQKTDIYSLGIVCMWILFWPLASISSPNEATTPSLWIETLRRSNSLCDEAIKMVDSILLDDERQRSRLRLFFQRALIDSPEDRSIYLPGLSDYNETGDEYSPLPGHFPVPHEAPYAALFMISRLLHDALRADYRLWKDIFQSLSLHAESNADQASRQNAAFQLSICYKIGFGCEKSETKSKAKLMQSGLTDQALQKELTFIQENKRAGPPPKGFLRKLGRKVKAQKYARDQVLDEAFNAHNNMTCALEGLLGKKDVRIIIQKVIIAEILYEQRDYENSERVALDALQNSTPETGKLMVLSTLRRFFYDTGHWSKMLDCAAQLFELQKGERSREFDQVYGDLETLHELKYLENKFASLHYERRFSEAVDIAYKCSELAKAVYGTHSLQKLHYDANLAMVYSSLHRLKESKELFQRAIEVGETNFGGTNEVVLYIKQLQIGSYKERADARKDLEHGAKILDDCRSALPPNHFTTKAMIQNMVHIYYREGYTREALQLAEENYRLSLASGDAWASSGAMFRLADLYWGLIRWEEAESLLVQAIGLLENVVQKENPKLLRMERRLKILYRWKRVWRLLGFVLPEKFIMVTAQGWSALTNCISRAQFR